MPATFKQLFACEGDIAQLRLLVTGHDIDEGDYGHASSGLGECSRWLNIWLMKSEPTRRLSTVGEGPRWTNPLHPLVVYLQAKGAKGGTNTPALNTSTELATPLLRATWSV